MVEVTLTEMEITLSAITGCLRRIKAMFLNFGCKLHAEKDRSTKEWSSDIEAACAETAAAKAMNIYHGYTMNSFKQPDIGEYQVRHTVPLNQKLLIRPDDFDDDIFFLVVGAAPKMFVIGHINKASDAKKQKYSYTHNNGEQCWLVPQRDLIPFGPPTPLKSWEEPGPNQWKEGDVW